MDIKNEEIAPIIKSYGKRIGIAFDGCGNASLQAEEKKDLLKVANRIIELLNSYEVH
jgi:hypothetical protein